MSLRLRERKQFNDRAACSGLSLDRPRSGVDWRERGPSRGRSGDLDSFELTGLSASHARYTHRGLHEPPGTSTRSIINRPLAKPGASAALRVLTRSNRSAAIRRFAISAMTPVSKMRADRAYHFDTDPRWPAPPVLPDIVSDRHRSPRGAAPRLASPRRFCESFRRKSAQALWG